MLPIKSLASFMPIPRFREAVSVGPRVDYIGKGGPPFLNMGGSPLAQPRNMPARGVPPVKTS